MFGRQKMDTSSDGVFKDPVYRKRPPMRRRRKKPSVYQVNKKVNKLYKRLQKEVDLKHWTVATNLENLVAVTPQYSSLVSGIVQGDTDQTRNGDKIRVQSIAWNMDFAVATNETGGTIIRFFIVYDRRPNGAQATYTNVLNAANTRALMNLDTQYLGRFQVLYDQTFLLDTADNQYAKCKGYRKVNLPVWYNANTGAIGDVQRGNLFAMIITQNNDQNMNAYGYIRLRFTDMS